MIELYYSLNSFINLKQIITEFLLKIYWDSIRIVLLGFILFEFSFKYFLVKNNCIPMNPNESQYMHWDWDY